MADELKVAQRKQWFATAIVKVELAQKGGPAIEQLATFNFIFTQNVKPPKSQIMSAVDEVTTGAGLKYTPWRMYSYELAPKNVIIKDKEKDADSLDKTKIEVVEA